MVEQVLDDGTISLTLTSSYRAMRGCGKTLESSLPLPDLQVPCRSIPPPPTPHSQQDQLTVQPSPPCLPDAPACPQGYPMRGCSWPHPTAKDRHKPKSLPLGLSHESVPNQPCVSQAHRKATAHTYRPKPCLDVCAPGWTSARIGPKPIRVGLLCFPLATSSVKNHF